LPPIFFEAISSIIFSLSFCIATSHDFSLATKHYCLSPLPLSLPHLSMALFSVFAVVFSGAKKKRFP
jgi:hypothetical protein